ncbi:RNA methyltransferase [uncultured Pseudoflavonifractor sp.]|uniref:TrmH family RNA methyltransferase n=1 Tax=uncultured Pseudoflavonifractor sp. TaxID=1221379 RepID=UPI0025F571BB|nr:RNA methyltransferase [uncultured Pseudoflavonifractor sp.]
MEHITSRQNPLMVRIKKLAHSRAQRREEGAFVCEGPKLIEEALKWGADVETILAAEGCSVPQSLTGRTRQVEVPDSLLRAVSSVETPQGLLAVCRTPALAPPDKLSGGRYLVLDGVQDPGNLGTIWRTADAFGADGLLLVNGCADPWSPKTIRATMGACFRLPAWETELETVRALLDGAGIPLYATALRADTADVREVDLKRSAVVIGSEGRGISEEALALCRRTIKIPMRTRCESLNAAMAAGIVLWEMCR